MKTPNTETLKATANLIIEIENAKKELETVERYYRAYEAELLSGKTSASLYLYRPMISRGALSQVVDLVSRAADAHETLAQHHAISRGSV